MSDGSWVRSVNNKGIYTGGQVKGGTVRADGRLILVNTYNWKELPLLAHHVRLTAL